MVRSLYADRLFLRFTIERSGDLVLSIEGSTHASGCDPRTYKELSNSIERTIKQFPGVLGNENKLGILTRHSGQLFALLFAQS